MKQKIAGYIVAVLFLVIGIVVMKKMIASKVAPEKKEIPALVKKVQVITASPEQNAINVSINGKLESFNKIEIFSEVSGVVLNSSKSFKEGVAFNTNEILVRIDSRDIKAALTAQRSAFQTLLNQNLTDIKLDYSDNFEIWNQYLNSFNPEKNIGELPQPKSDKEKRFLISKNIYNSFYNIKSQELKLSKYTVKAPFSGVLSNVTIQNGSVIRPGQKLGEFIQPNDFELEAPINVKDVNFLSVGDKVKLSSNDIDGNWVGKIKRIGKNVDAQTQSVLVYIGLNSKELKEGMYLKGNIESKTINNSIVLPRKILNKDGSIYLVEKDKLIKKQPKIEKVNESTILITGIVEGEKIISDNFVGAYEGLEVVISK